MIYLQHGVLHINMPWKYSRECILADKIVISTEEEKRLLEINNYRDEDLICAGMPRFDYISKGKSKNKILFAPSWRSYLVGNNTNRKWQSLDEKFYQSNYYKGIEKLLNSKELDLLLEENDFIMEFKVHPIFKCYEKLFRWDSKNIKFADENVKESDYNILITDFSSFMYNFIYLSIPVINFIPDISEFLCGMNGYRELSNNELIENAMFDADTLIDKLRIYLYNGKSEQKICTFFDVKNKEQKIYDLIKIK